MYYVEINDILYRYIEKFQYSIILIFIVNRMIEILYILMTFNDF